MKSIVVIMIIVMASGIAYADPRIHKNFCHFIKDPDNTNNEIKFGDCGGKIAEDGEGGANGLTATRTPTVASSSWPNPSI